MKNKGLVDMVQDNPYQSPRVNCIEEPELVISPRAKTLSILTGYFGGLMSMGLTFTPLYFIGSSTKVQDFLENYPSLEDIMTKLTTPFGAFVFGSVSGLIIGSVITKYSERYFARKEALE